MEKIIDLDRNATFGLSAEVQKRLFSIELGNPSSIHQQGQKARLLVEQAKEALAQLLGVSLKEVHIIFTSGATEANNQILFSPFWHQLKNPNKGVITSAVEHPCVLLSVERLAELGIPADFIGVNKVGDLDCSRLFSILSEKPTALVSLMQANNETGVFFPLAEIFAQVKKISPSTLCHTDASQCVGKLSFTFAELGCDALTLSGHKFGALPGVGALVIKRGIHLEPYLQGGPQQGRMRAGTEPLLGIASLAFAAEESFKLGQQRAQAMQEKRDYLAHQLGQKIASFSIIGSGARLPNTLLARFPGISSAELVVALDLQGILTSSGAACSSGKPGGSHVLAAMGYTEAEAQECVRFSLSGSEEYSELDRVVNAVVGFMKQI